MRRREFIASAAAAGAATFFSPSLLRRALAATAVAGEGPYGPLVQSNLEGILLPEGFSVRRIVRGGETIGGYPWHFLSDGGACYQSTDGGWIYVSNSESPAVTGGGSSAIKFSPDGEVERAYRILAGTNLNCGGGPTPWGTWLSGEEHQGGMLWEADPAGILPAQPRPALGNFAHEAAAVDAQGFVYETEDTGDGCFYRFRPDTPGDLTAGVLEVAEWKTDGSVVWHEVPDPNAILPGTETRKQVPQATRFNGGEGIFFFEGKMYWTTKGDRKVWVYDTVNSQLEVLFDRSLAPDAALNAVDNVTVSAVGDVFVCEDGGNMEIGLIQTDLEIPVVSPFVRIEGQDFSEMCGVSFSPDGKRMYFASQREGSLFPNGAGVHDEDEQLKTIAFGAVYEVTGPFRLPPGGVIPADQVYGPPAGERALASIPLPLPPGLGLSAPRRTSRGRLIERGLRFELDLGEAAEVHAILRTADIKRVKTERWHDARPALVTLGSRERDLEPGKHTLAMPVRKAAAKRLSRKQSSRATLTVVAKTASGKRLVATHDISVTR